MGKYLKQFTNHADYETFVGGGENFQNQMCLFA